MAPISDIQRQTFTEIYETYSGKLYGVCRHYVRDHELALDLLHDSFIVIFSSLDQLRERSKMEAWMCAIVRNIALKHLRKSQMMPEISLEDIAEPGLEESHMHFSEIPLDQLLKVVDDLPEQYGKVFRLSVLDGLSHKEIGEMLGIAPHSSSSNLTRAKQLLRKAVSKNWGIILTFCLCIIAVLFAIKDDGNESMVAEGRTFGVIPAERVDILTADIPEVRRLPDLEYRVRQPMIPDSETVTVPEEIHDTGNETIEEKITVPSETAEPTETYDNSEDWLYEEARDQRRRIRAGSLTYGFGGTIGNSATGKEPGSSITQPPGTDLGGPGYTDGAGNVGSGTTDGTTPPGTNPPGTGQPVKPDTGGSAQVQERHYRHAMPVSFAVSARYSFTDRWALTSGLQYTYLHSDITEGGRKYDQDIHYIGIPLKASWTFWKSAVFNAYASVGTTVEFPVACRVDGYSRDLPCQWSAGLGLGLQYDITRNVGIYIEPELNRYFDNGSTIKTVRTERPVTVTIPVGIRFSW